MDSNLKTLLTQINDSLETTLSSLDILEENDVNLDLKSNILLTSIPIEKVSLLSLKNGSMLSYITGLLMIIAGKLDQTNNQDIIEKGRIKCIENRVVLERGIKSLEKRLEYQLDKLVRSYQKFQKECQDSKDGANEKNQQNNQSDQDDNSSDEEISYKPNFNNLLDKNIKNQNTNDSIDPDTIYKPPKISAALPPKQHHFQDKFDSNNHKDKSNRLRMQAMEEYIMETEDAPEYGASIGTNIVNHGKGGIKSMKDTEREKAVKQYEEDNFTRLNLGGNKLEKRKAKQRERTAKVNMIGGEDFSIFNSKRKLEDSTTRRGAKKSRNAWERVKKRL